MKLLSIKSHGFKSFADKIEISVEDGITGIVGPNGSGKSNIVDAVRWVLGEQSIKNLRGTNNMTDVIFQGSRSRSPQSRAWVSLTLDNSDHYLNTDFKEVEIKRVVYSSGENEYYINNIQSRLKDITELFIDSGTSTNSFSIIGQGKISEILSGKKEDRRAIIEEAAGVLKYKKRKESTLKKIDSTNDNIEKIDLVINELEQNLEPLRIQSESARKYLNIKNELDDIDIKLTLIDIKSLKEQSEINNKQIEELNAKILSMDSSTSIDSATQENLKLKNIKIDNELNSLNDKLIALNKEISEVNAKKQVMLERKKYEVDDIKLQNNIVSLKEEELKIKKNISVIKEEVKVLKELLENDNNKLDKLRNDYKILYLNKTNYENNLKTKKIKEIELTNKIDILEYNIENDSKIPSAVRNILGNNRLDGIHNIVGKIIDSEEIYGTALNIALGYNSNVIIVDNEIVTKNAIKYLCDNKLGRCTFYPLNIIKPKYVDNTTLNLCNNTKGYINTLDNLVTYDVKYSNIVKNLLGNIIVVNDINTMNELGKRINYTYRIVTLNGDILHTGGAITGGSQRNNNSIILDKFELNSKKNELLNVVTDISSLESKLNDTNNELNILDNNIQQMNNLINNSNNKISIKNNDLDTLNIKIESIYNEINGTNNVINNNVDKEINNILENYYKLTSHKEILINKINNLKANKNDIQSEINEIELETKKANSDYNKLVNNLKTLEIDQSKYDIKLDNLLIKLNEEYTMTYDEALKKYDIDIDIESSRIRCSSLKREISLLHDINTGSISEFERVNERYEFLTNQKNDLVCAINNLINIITDLDKTMIDKFESTFNKVNEEFNHVFKKLFKGGKGELILTDKNDLLNTGVDIIAEPPGKTLKTINLLSGGEKTLTAIALLFAILNIRTVPFCILDEVEAALDEANVDTFGSYLTDYQNKTQFIIITHKKRTMEYANTLYGITMQESGVSKLVSVKLSDIK